jgi:hypothetical protein
MTLMRGVALWVVWFGYEGVPFAEGHAQTELEALTAAYAATAKQLPTNAWVILSASSSAAAEKRARELRAAARLLRPGTPAGPQRVEYVYSHHKQYELFNDRYSWVTHKARILKKTAKYVFIEDTTNTYATADGVLVLKQHMIDRAKLESTGAARHWVTSPYPPDDGTATNPTWADVLGVKPTSSMPEVKRAYRSKAAAAHPDQGGTAAEFKRVCDAFKAAERAFKQRAPA